MKIFENYKLVKSNGYIKLIDGRNLYEGRKIEKKGQHSILKYKNSAEKFGPYNKGCPLTMLKSMAQYQIMMPPIKGRVEKVFANTTKLRNKSRSWESHRTTNHDLLLETRADNMTTRDINVVAILELAAATAMTLRIKELSEKEDDFYPLNDPNWINEDDLIEIESSADMFTVVDEKDITTSIEKLIKAFMFDAIDDGAPVTMERRNGEESEKVVF